MNVELCEVEWRHRPRYWRRRRWRRNTYNIHVYQSETMWGRVYNTPVAFAAAAAISLPVLYFFSLSLSSRRRCLAVFCVCIVFCRLWWSTCSGQCKHTHTHTKVHSVFVFVCHVVQQFSTARWRSQQQQKLLLTHSLGGGANRTKLHTHTHTTALYCTVRCIVRVKTRLGREEGGIVWVSAVGLWKILPMTCTVVYLYMILCMFVCGLKFSFSYSTQWNDHHHHHHHHHSVRYGTRYHFCLILAGTKTDFVCLCNLSPIYRGFVAS